MSRPSHPDLDVVVVGAGVIGLAVARALARTGREVTVLEAEAAPGRHTSSRNSEVIHAGIYYPTGSLKARLCVAGKEALYAYCAARGIPHQRIGKILVATGDDQLPALERHRTQAVANGVNDLAWLDAAEIHALEPAVNAVAGLHSPSTGIIDSHALMLALRGDAEAHGARVVLSAPATGGEVREDGSLTLEVAGKEATVVTCRAVVNAGGLFAQTLARQIRGLPAASVPACHYAIGHYFVLSGPSPFRRLVYPMPPSSRAGLGIHVTLDLAGRARFGPDVGWVDTVDYAFDETRALAFYAAIRSYFPALREGSLEPGYTGIRPKLGPAGSPAQDFVIQGPRDHGVPGYVGLYGIESPGLTACLAIADYVKALLDDSTPPAAPTRP